MSLLKISFILIFMCIGQLVWINFMGSSMNSLLMIWMVTLVFTYIIVRLSEISLTTGQFFEMSQESH